MGIKRLREDEKGSGLVMTLMVLLVLSVLGVSIGTLTLGSYRLSAANRDDTSAYYVAEAAAVDAYDDIQRSVLSAYESNATEGSFNQHVSSIVTSKNGQSAVAFGEQFGTEPTATIATTQNDTNSYTITSTGEVDGKKRTVTKPFTVNWIEKNTGSGGGLPTLPEKTALLVDEEMRLLGGTLNGNAYIQSTDNNAVKMGDYGEFTESTLHYSSQTTPDKLINYKEWFKNNLPKLSTEIQNIDFELYRGLISQVKVPTATITDFNRLTDETIKKDEWNSYKVLDNGNLLLNNWMLETYNLEVTDNIAFKKIIIESGKTLTIDTMGGNRTISVEDLLIGSGTLNIVGGGTVTLVVNNLQLNSSNLNIVGDSAVTFLLNDLQMTSSSFTISKEGTARMVVDGKMTFNHDLFINKAGTSDQLLLMYTGPTPNFNNITKMNAHVVVLGNKGPVNVDDSNINGVFLTDNNKVNFTSGNNKEGASNIMLIAPNATASLSGSYSIKGTVIANKLELTESALLEYAEVKTDGFPSGGAAAPTVSPEPEDIISAGAIIEN